MNPYTDWTWRDIWDAFTPSDIIMTLLPLVALVALVCSIYNSPRKP